MAMNQTEKFPIYGSETKEMAKGLKTRAGLVTTPEGTGERINKTQSSRVALIKKTSTDLPLD
jgi:hypothetical protein